MTVNLCTDKCEKCNYQFGLADFIGQPIEFRQYGDYKPNMGTKLRCKCGKVYFGWIREDYQFWGSNTKDQFENDKINFGYGEIDRKNIHKGKFAKRVGNSVVELGYYQIDLAYYENYNNEGEGIDTDSPKYLITEDHELTRLYNA